MKAVIFDVDGTLANCEHRVHHDQNGQRDWPAFFDAMHLDTPIAPIVWLNQQLFKRTRSPEVRTADFLIIIVSARPSNYKKVTQKWLDENGVRYHSIYMRDEGDYRQDSIVKQEILQQILDDGHEPWLVVDDRPQVVEMWRSMGICTLQCAADQFGSHSKYAGQTLFHMMIGPSGAGKSTYISKNYKPCDIVSTDQIRVDLFGSHDGPGVHSPENMARTWNYAHALIEARLKNGVFTVLDATNIRNKDRLTALKLVPAGQLVQYVLIDREFDEKLKTRGWRSEELIKKHHNTFHSNLKDILRGDDQPNVIVLDRREHKV